MGGANPDESGSVSGGIIDLGGSGGGGTDLNRCGSVVDLGGSGRVGVDLGGSGRVS